MKYIVYNMFAECARYWREIGNSDWAISNECDRKKSMKYIVYNMFAECARYWREIGNSDWAISNECDCSSQLLG
jgi:hypothetical protein